MQANLETLSGLERRLNVAVPLSEIETQVETRLKQISRTAKMPGFRPGKVPFKTVQQHYGASVREEVMGATIVNRPMVRNVSSMPLAYLATMLPAVTSAANATR